MKKILLPLIAISICITSKSQDTSLHKSAIAVCDCLTKNNLSSNASPEEMQKVFLNCIFSSAPDLITKIVSSGQDYQKAGEEMGTQLAMEMMKTGCPAFTKMATSLAMTGGDSTVDMSDLLSGTQTQTKIQTEQSVDGTVTNIEEKDFTYITVKTSAGRELTFMYYEYVPGSDDWIKNATIKLKNKKVSLSYVETEVYQPKYKQFMNIKEIKTLTIQ